MAVTEDFLIQATATIIAARIQARATTKAAGNGAIALPSPELEKEFAETFMTLRRAVQVVSDQIGKEDAARFNGLE